MTAAILPEPQMQQTNDCNNSQKLPCFVFLRDTVAKQAARPEITSEFPLQLFPLFAANACHPFLACLIACLLACRPACLLTCLSPCSLQMIATPSLLACLLACLLASLLLPLASLSACQPAPCSPFRWMKHRACKD